MAMVKAVGGRSGLAICDDVPSCVPTAVMFNNSYIEKVFINIGKFITS